MSVTVIRLQCGHVADPKERLRYGPEKWCVTCCNWQFQVEDAK
jgi:hypothetical protein